MNQVARLFCDYCLYWTAFCFCVLCMAATMRMMVHLWYFWAAEVFPFLSRAFMFVWKNAPRAPRPGRDPLGRFKKKGLM